MSNLSAILGGINRIRGGTTQIPITRPDLAGATSVTASSVAWTYGSWSEVAAANDLSDHMLIGWYGETGSAMSQARFQVQVGTGGAGAETAVGTWPVKGSNGLINDGVQVPYVIDPPIVIPVNARVAARCASAETGGVVFPLKLMFSPRPR